MKSSVASYKHLLTYWFAVIIYDLTVEFCSRWIKSWKLKEQMTGAARSGKQNIVEGSDGMKTSLKTAIKLTNVAKASLEELSGDYEDFLRQRSLRQWDKNDKRIMEFRGKSSKLISNLSSLGYLGQKPLLPENQEKAANLLLTLCHQATFLLNRQVEGLENKHLKEGGYTEQLYRKRINYRQGI